jgi:thioredoxin
LTPFQGTGRTVFGVDALTLGGLAREAGVNPETIRYYERRDEQLAVDVAPLLVDFWGEWCGPCKLIEPILEEIAAIHAGRLTVVRRDLDDNPGVAVRYGVMSVPTLLLFREGEPVLRMVGARGRGQLLEIEPYLLAEDHSGQDR